MAERNMFITILLVRIVKKDTTIIISVRNIASIEVRLLIIITNTLKCVLITIKSIYTYEKWYIHLYSDRNEIYRYKCE